ncbi:LAME_0A03774g1_1 [Lachancea meyersii CBS 8951]|uniref:Histone acetyltransferase type B catalytic subunit n=1 Tax=Lachancea meyersii CBS 8951 TaxID=1266667 RepID=A0A1G4INZ7_9SACH|nr:LAME_0A03774g1_1 [Lachancea meyersii CBS 8951]
MDAASQMKPEAWTVSSNEALKLSLVDETGAVQFSPIFTYPIFGDSEQVFGYQDLQIFLAFDSVTFKPFSNVKYGAKLVDTVDDVQDKVLSFLPKGDVIVKNEEEWVDAFTKERQSFALPKDSSRIGSYETAEDEFAMFKVNFQDPEIRALHGRMQIFTLLFIESASYIDDDDDGWELFLTFNLRTKQCIGYCTTYQYWKYSGNVKLDQDVETYKTAKISQFLIFPPYQGKGHGSILYNAIMKNWIDDPKVLEITVEDPNESFDALRDRCDYRRLRDSGFNLCIPDELPINENWIEFQRTSLKLEKRQFMRLVEMFLMSNSSSKFRLQVKKRLYEKNYELLRDLDAPTRNDKLQTAFLSISKEYEAVISTVLNNKRTVPEEMEPINKKTKI